MTTCNNNKKTFTFLVSLSIKLAPSQFAGLLCKTSYLAFIFYDLFDNIIGSFVQAWQQTLRKLLLGSLLTLD